MGRHSKGERRQLMTRIPPQAGDELLHEVKGLGCTYSDFIAFVLCQDAGVLAERPTGEVTHHPEPREAPGNRVEVSSRVSLEVADHVSHQADERGISIADYIAVVICERYDVPFEPRVKKKALRAWAAQTSTAGARLRPTG